MKDPCRKEKNAIGKFYTNLFHNNTFCKILCILLLSIPYALLQKHFIDTESTFWINYAEGVTIIGLSSLVGSHFLDKKEEDEEEDES